MLLQVAKDSLSIIWFTNDPFRVKGIAIYNAALAMNVEEVKTVLRDVERHIAHQMTVTVCYDFPESILVPGKFHRSGLNAEALALIYGDASQCSYNDDLVSSADIYNHYRLPASIEKEISRQFPNAKVFHSTSLQLENLRNENDLLYCIIYHSRIKLILIREGRLIIAQQFRYEVPTDAAYHLLNACEQHGVDASNIPLRVTGMIDEKSILSQELHKYFGEISFDNTNAAEFDSKEAGLPSHFFSHLTALARCVS